MTDHTIHPMGPPSEGVTPFAVDCLHAAVLGAAPVALRPVLDEYGDDTPDVVLLAVPKGTGVGVATYLAERFRMTEEAA